MSPDQWSSTFLGKESYTSCIAVKKEQHRDMEDIFQKTEGLTLLIKVKQNKTDREF